MPLPHANPVQWPADFYSHRNHVPDTATPFRHLLAPRYWPWWIILGLLRLINLLPYGMQLRIGAQLGGLLFHLAPRRRRIAEINLELCFPELDNRQRRALNYRHFQSLGMSLLETTFGWWGSDRRLRPLLKIQGMEHLENALAKGKGVLLLSGHYACLDLTGRLFHLHIQHPLSGMYRANENPVVEYLYRTHRTRMFRQLIARDDVRSVLRRLKKNELIWYAPDQAYRGRGSVVAPFFNNDAATGAGTSRLAKLSQATVVPFHYQRLPDGKGYLFTFHPGLTQFPGDDEAADATLINHTLETMIRLAPEQYFWLHRRFKRRGNRADPYTALE